ncbi:MAG: flagellar hook-basal body complex protein, partial [Limnohabitans sp.]
MSFYTSLTGLNSATAQLAITSNNIANVGTAGFKRSRADFGDIFSTSPLQKSSSQIGQGVSLKQVSQEFSQGNISTSGNSLDLAITGDGFFPLKTADGLQDIYTRNGSFTLNDQNNVVNSTGQRLMAASVDSSGKADLTNLNPLTIPNKTSGEARETTSIQLGLNLPADSEVIVGDFDRTNPATYNKSTALTVYDSGGNGYLATVYYVKTQNASQSSPFSKWQSYFFVGDTQVKPALQQASDKTGSTLYVNKYGEVAPKSDSRVIPSSGTTEMYTLDQLTNTQTSSPASVTASSVSVSGTELAMTGATLADGTKKLEVKYKASPTATTIETLTYNLGPGDRYPEVLARNVQDALNAKLAQSGTERATVKAVETVSGTNTTVTYEVRFTGTSVEEPANSFSTTLTTAQTGAFVGTPAATKVSFEIAVDGANTPQTIAYTLTKQDKNPDILARNLEIAINNKLGSLDAASARFGVRVTFDPESA